LSAELTKTHSSRLFFCDFADLEVETVYYCILNQNAVNY